MASSAEIHDPNDGILRPRPRKPVHSQLSQLTSSTSASTSGYLDHNETGATTGQTSGRSTPIPADALPSVKVLSSARRQARAEQKRRIFPTIEFASRVSHFDPNSDYRDFHGFFNLFWVGLFIMGITSMLRNLKETGWPFRVQIWTLFTIKWWHLGLVDFAMVASASLVYPLQLYVRKQKAGGAMTWAKGGMAVQSIYQAAWMAFWVAAPFVLEWPWTSQVFLILHTMVILMKMHSYGFYNGHLSETEKRLHDLDNPKTASREPAYLYPTADNPGGTVSSPLQSKHAGDEEDEEPTDSQEEEEELAQLREDLARELTSPMGNVTYPANLTWPNYVDFLFCPTLCYEIEYPRFDSIDWKNLFAKITAVFGCIFLLTVISEEFILPTLQESSARLHGSDPNPGYLESLLIMAETVSWLLFPFMLTFLLVFLVIFEYVLGAFAEITRFADRHFYSDWWNSTDWMEFSREWNIPVYSFLRRHVYSASRPHIGRAYATVITFLISAVGHEIVMACITKKLRGYGFICQMLQLPIVVLQRTKYVRGKKTFNNVAFWSSMILGLSLICSLYVLI